jgi:ribosome-binding protein aMBF1 (putative translation factor)
MWKRCELCGWPRYGGGQALLVLEGVVVCPDCFRELERPPSLADQQRRRLDVEGPSPAGSTPPGAAELPGVLGRRATN